MLTTTTLSRRARIYAGLLLVLCLVAVIVVYFDSHRTAQDGIRIEFKRRAELIAAVLEKSLEGRLDILRSIVGVHEVDEGLTREEFRKFVARFFATHPDLHG
ncbi:MAG: hypothetical protein OER88_06740, partial [Planctomycetota bacterium]|nr:hypothetical protein [Planctomycetota bacterium]